MRGHNRGGGVGGVGGVSGVGVGGASEHALDEPGVVSFWDRGFGAVGGGGGGGGGY